MHDQAFMAHWPNKILAFFVWYWYFWCVISPSAKKTLFKLILWCHTWSPGIWVNINLLCKLKTPKLLFIHLFYLFIYPHLPGAEMKKQKGFVCLTGRSGPDQGTKLKQKYYYIFAIISIIPIYLYKLVYPTLFSLRRPISDVQHKV